MPMKLAVITAVYPAVMKYLKDFFKTLENQTDQCFTLWIGLDGVKPDDVVNLPSHIHNIHFVTPPPLSTPAEVRNAVLAVALPESDAVALIDADDLLAGTRVEAAKQSVGKADLTATCMRYIDDDGSLLDGIFDPALGDLSLVHTNVFGFSNTTWKSDTLANFLPVPKSCILMDWYVSTLAVWSGAKPGIDPTPRMYYRQHRDNIANVRPPFSAKQITRATGLVLSHYDLVLDALKTKDIRGLNVFIEARNRAQNFSKAISDPELLRRYLKALNELPPRHVWWTCVANPNLEYLWEK